jgi:hypothetical protein
VELPTVRCARGRVGNVMIVLAKSNSCIVQRCGLQMRDTCMTRRGAGWLTLGVWLGALGYLYDTRIGHKWDSSVRIRD